MPVFRNSPVLRVMIASPRQAAVAARKASGRWSSSGSPFPPFFFHDAGACSGIGQGPIEYPLLEKLVEKILKPLGQFVPARSGVKTADAVEDFPDGNGGKTDPVHGDRIEEPGDSRLRVRPHHLRDDVRVKQPDDWLGHVLLSSANSTGL